MSRKFIVLGEKKQGVGRQEVENVSVRHQGALKPRTAGSCLDEWGQTEEGHREEQCWLSHLHLGSFRGWGCVIWRMLILCFLLSIPFIWWSLAVYKIIYRELGDTPPPAPLPGISVKKQRCYPEWHWKIEVSLCRTTYASNTVSSWKAHNGSSWYPLKNPRLWELLLVVHSSRERVRWPHGSLGGLPTELAFVRRADSQGRYHSGWHVPHFPSWSKGRLKKNLNLIHSKAANDCFRPWDRRLHFHYLSQCL